METEVVDDFHTLEGESIEFGVLRTYFVTIGKDY